MVILHIWTAAGRTDVTIAEDNLEYELQVIEHDPEVIDYSITSL